MLPPLVPDTRRIGIPAFSKTSRTLRWAIQRAAPPLNAIPSLATGKILLSTKKSSGEDFFVDKTLRMV
jgi:hypothetical protein